MCIVSIFCGGLNQISGAKVVVHEPRGQDQATILLSYRVHLMKHNQLIAFFKHSYLLTNNERTTFSKPMTHFQESHCNTLNVMGLFNVIFFSSLVDSENGRFRSWLSGFASQYQGFNLMPNVMSS